jgi:hypothetical protein
MHLQKLLFASAVLVAMSGSARSEDIPPEITNCWMVPVGNPTGVEFDYQGDKTSVIPPQVTADPQVNPWYGQHQATPSFNYNPVTVAFDSGANLTRVILSGDPLPNPRSTLNTNPDQDDSYHPGMNSGWQVVTPGPLVSREWLYPASSSQLPAPQVSWNGVYHGKPKKLLQAVIYVGAGNGTSACWSAEAYQPPGNGATEFKIANNTDAPIIIDVVGYLLGLAGPQGAECRKSPQCTANQKALDKLNGEFYPVPGDAGSPFTRVKAPKTPLQPGESFVFKAR